MIKTCVVCGKEFDGRQRPHFNFRTCSPECEGENKRQNHLRATRAYRERTRLTRIGECKACGGKFKITPTRRAYCSDLCRRAGVNETNRRQYLKNRDSRIDACRNWRKNNRDRVNDAVKRYKEASPEKVAAWKENSRERRIAADRVRNAKRSAALKLVRELQSKGIEALL